MKALPGPGEIIRTKPIGRTDANGNYSLTFAMRDDEIERGYFFVEYEVNESEYLTFADDCIPFHHLKPVRFCGHSSKYLLMNSTVA